MIFIDVRDQNCFNASILDTVPCVHDEGNTHMATSTSTAPPVTSENELSDLEILEATVEAVTAALPFRLNPSSTAKTAGKLAKATLTQPRALARRVVSLNGEALKIAAGLSTVAPAKGDRRFADEAFENGHFYKRLAQGLSRNRPSHQRTAGRSRPRRGEPTAGSVPHQHSAEHSGADQHHSGKSGSHQESSANKGPESAEGPPKRGR